MNELRAKLEAQWKHTDATLKIMIMMKKSMQSGGVMLEIPTKQGTHMCPNCKKIVYHSANECFKLDKNKEK